VRESEEASMRVEERLKEVLIQRDMKIEDEQNKSIWLVDMKEKEVEHL